MRIVCLSDTHGRHQSLKVPDGDLLLHCGDLTSQGHLPQLAEAADWLRSLPHRHKVLIAGNHDFCLEQTSQKARKLLRGLTYLQDEAVQIEGLRIYGSPWQPWFYDWAFNLRRGEPLRKVWARIPSDTNILLTHGPPHGVLDLNSHGHRTGCEELLLRLQQIKPGLHVFGHIHEGYGLQKFGDGWCVNASVCNLQYLPCQAPVVMDWHGNTGGTRVQPAEATGL